VSFHLRKGQSWERGVQRVLEGILRVPALRILGIDIDTYTRDVGQRETRGLRKFFEEKVEIGISYEVVRVRVASLVAFNLSGERNARGAAEVRKNILLSPFDFTSAV